MPLPDGGVVRTYVDVTARRAAEVAAVEGERRFRLLAETTMDVIIWSGLDTVRRYESPASLAVFGHSPEDLIGTRPLDHVHPDDRTAYSAVLDDLCSGRLDQAVTCQRIRTASTPPRPRSATIAARTPSSLAGPMPTSAYSSER